MIASIYGTAITLVLLDGFELRRREVSMDEVYERYPMRDVVLDVPAPTYEQLQELRRYDPDVVFASDGPRRKQHGPKPHRKFPVPR